MLYRNTIYTRRCFDRRSIDTTSVTQTIIRSIAGRLARRRLIAFLENDEDEDIAQTIGLSQICIHIYLAIGIHICIWLCTCTWTRPHTRTLTRAHTYKHIMHHARRVAIARRWPIELVAPVALQVSARRRCIVRCAPFARAGAIWFMDLYGCAHCAWYACAVCSRAAPFSVVERIEVEAIAGAVRDLHLMCECRQPDAYNVYGRGGKMHLKTRARAACCVHCAHHDCAFDNKYNLFIMSDGADTVRCHSKHI